MGRKIPKKPSTPASDRTLEMWAREVPPANVEIVRIPQARTLHTVPVNRVEHVVASQHVHGSIFRIKTFEHDTDEGIASAKATLKQAGAAFVFVLPKPRGTVLPEEKVKHVRARSHRAVITMLVAESAFEDKPSLGEVVEEIAASEGL